MPVTRSKKNLSHSLNEIQTITRPLWKESPTWNNCWQRWDDSAETVKSLWERCTCMCAVELFSYSSSQFFACWDTAQWWPNIAVSLILEGKWPGSSRMAAGQVSVLNAAKVTKLKLHSSSMPRPNSKVDNSVPRLRPMVTRPKFWPWGDSRPQYISKTTFLIFYKHQSEIKELFANVLSSSK